MRETIFRLDSLQLPVADSSIVDDGFERAERIDLFCHLSSLGNCAEIADNDCFRLRDISLCLVGAGLAADVVCLRRITIGRYDVLMVTKKLLSEGAPDYCAAGRQKIAFYGLSSLPDQIGT